MKVGDIVTELQTLDTQRPGTWPRWVQIFVAVLLSAFIVGIGVYLIIMPDYDQLGVEQKTEQNLRAEFERKQRKVAALDAYKQQLAEMQHTFGDMLKQLPSKTEVANLLNDISQARVASGLEEELFQPLPEIPKDFYAEIPNKIVVTGDYHEMGSFVAAVAALPRIVTIDEVDLHPLSDKGHKGDLRMTALAKTYRYLDESEQAAGAKKK